MVWPVLPSETYAAPVGQLVHEAAVPVVEYLPAVQFEHTLSAVARARSDWPGAHGVLGVQEVAFAPDQLTPAVQFAHTLLDEPPEQVEARYEPAAQTLDEHFAQGAKPVADHEVPSTHAGTGSHVSVEAFHLKAGSLQAQLVWPSSVLLVLYSRVVGHKRQAVSPSTENFCAAHALQTMLAVALQVEVPSQTEPAAHAVVLVQPAQGARPVALQVEPLTQGSEHVLLAVFQA